MRPGEVSSVTVDKFCTNATIWGTRAGVGWQRRACLLLLRLLAGISSVLQGR